MNLFEQLYIADLIVKAIAGSLSGEEVVELRLWRESSEENERLYQELLTMGGMELQQKEVALFVPETAWKMLSEKVSGKRKHRAGSNILKYAAVACAVLGIAVSVFYISGNKTPETVEAVAVAQVPAIAHGSSKAVFSRYEDITKVLKLLSATRLVSFRYANHKIMVEPYQRS